MCCPTRHTAYETDPQSVTDERPSKIASMRHKSNRKHSFCLEENSVVQCAAAVIRNQYLVLEVNINNPMICSLISYTTVGKQCLNNSFHPLLANIVNENESAVTCFQVFHDERCYINNTFP